MPAPHHSVFLQAGCPSCHPTNSVKAMKVKDEYSKLNENYFGLPVSENTCTYRRGVPRGKWRREV